LLSSHKEDVGTVNNQKGGNGTFALGESGVLGHFNEILANAKNKFSTRHAYAANKKIKVSATAYTANCRGCSGITRTGINLLKNPHLKVISVDPRVIPLGSKVYVPGYGTAIAGDTGGAIKGNKIDLFIPTRQAALKWGRKTVTIEILSKSSSKKSKAKKAGKASKSSKYKVVKRGDSLAKMFPRNWRSVASKNKINPHKIRVGQKIYY
jgi:3D (Asp-Asp-Asp) domain-containing protein